MNKLTLLFGVVLCLVMVNARHFERSDVEDENNEEARKVRALQPRHRRRRWEMNYGYNYPPSRYFPDRRDSYDRNNPELIQNIYRLLEEIASTLKSRQAPPPPQPIYVPYPVPYYVPQVACDKKQEKMPNVTKRFPAMEDTNQNWGFVPEDDGDDDLGDGARPISLEPIVPKHFMKRPPPPVEHGSHQASASSVASQSDGVQKFGSASAAPSPLAGTPGMCNAAVLSCCFSSDKLEQKQCFNNIGCIIAFDNGNACNPDSVHQALELFKTAYSPRN